MSRSFDSLIPIRRILKKVGDAYTRMTFRPALVIEGDGVTVTDDPTYVDEFGNTVGKTVVAIAGDGVSLASTTPLVESGAGSVGVATTAARADHVHPASGGGGSAYLDPVGAFAAATVNATSVAIGNGDAPAVYDSESMLLVAGAVPPSAVAGHLTAQAALGVEIGSDEGNVQVTVDDGNIVLSGAGLGSGITLETLNGGPINLATAGGTVDINSDGEALTITGGTTNITGGAITVSGTTTSVNGSTAVHNLAPTIVIGRTVAGNRETHTLSGSSHVRTVTDNANATALTETCLAAGCTVAAAGTLTCSGTTSGFSGSTATNLGTSAGNTVTLSTSTSTLSVNAATYNTASTTFSAYALGTMTLQAYGTSLSLECNSYVMNQGPVAGTRRIQDRYPVAVTPGSSAATAIGTVTVPASSSGEWSGTIDLRSGSANHEVYDVWFLWNSDATTVTSRDLTVTLRGTTLGTIATVVGDVTKGDAGLIVTISVANASGIKCALTGRGRINS